MNSTYDTERAQAEKTAMAHMSPRGMRLERLARWVSGTQYHGRPSWWDGNVPLWEREPCIVYPVVEIAVGSNVDLCMGEGKFPSFTVAHSGNGGTGAEQGEKTDPLDVFLRHYHRLSRFPTACREAYRDGQGTGTAVTILGARDGRPTQDLVPAKWCEREVNQKGEVTKLTIEYPYLEEYRKPDGSWGVRTMLYRRVIDEKRDVTYLPSEASESGVKPNWQEDKDRTVSHGLGFCPVIWYAFMRGCQPVNVIDGTAIHARITDEIQAHDIARSQWHRGALLSEPQIYEIGVAPGFNPTGSGRAAIIPSTEHGGVSTPDNRPSGGFIEGSQSGNGARKKGPGHTWQYPDANTKVGTIEYSAGALKAQQDNCSDLRIKLQESMAVVFLDPENIKFAATTSGKALEAIKQKQLDRVSEHREDLRDNFMVPCVVMQLRIARKLGKALMVPGIDEALTVLGSQEFSAPDVEVTWGDYFKPDPQEQKALIELVKEALKDNPLLTMRVAIEKIAPIFGIKDIDAFMLELEKEAEKRAEKMATELRRMNGDTDGAVQSDSVGVRQGGNRGRPAYGQVDASSDGQ